MALKILDKISEVSKVETPQENEPQVEIPKTKYLFFFIGEKKYAVKENQVLKVLRDYKLYYFPFAPEFIEGVVNCHDKVCPAVDFSKLTGTFSEKTDISLFIVIKADNDYFSLRVSSVEDFFMIPDESFYVPDEAFWFVQGLLNLDDKQIPVLNVQAINQKIESACKQEA